MATTIQQIELPKKARAVDTSGNNNHGQIYSGRGLEFDGIADYLTTGYGNGLNPYTTPITVAIWANSGALSKVLIGATSGTNQRFYIGQYVGAWDMGIQNSAWNTTTNEVADFSNQPSNEVDTWYRIVVVMSAGQATMYVNGVKSYAKTYTSYVFNSDITIGNYDPTATNFYWDGMMSDVQIWDAAFTQADVTYDYLNPESLALNNSGTALTESNLKLWYPMQDGHRGQQSYILDGANTGAGEELVTNGGFDTDLSGWTLIGVNGDNNVTWVDGKARFLYDDAISTSALGISQSSVTAGVNYKITFDIVVADGTLGKLKFYNNTTETSTNLGTGSHTIYFTALGSYIKFYRNSSSVDTDLTIDNISIKPINDKNHATTVFYGDEMWDGTQGDDANWSLFGNNTKAEDAGAVKITYVDNAAGGYIMLRNATDLNADFVVGRTYIISFSTKVNQGSIAWRSLTSGVGGVNATATAITSTSFETRTMTVVANHATDLYIHSNLMATGDIVWIKDISVKEVGVASGWTDADQQLHIPQTALQSYNELAWFDGAADYVQLSDPYNHNLITVSAWIYLNEDTTLYRAIFANRDSGDDGLVIAIKPDETLWAKFNGTAVDSSATIPKGKWTHVVYTYDDATMKVYINGVFEDSTAFTGSDIAVTTNARIGIDTSSTQYYFPGSMTEVSIWGAALTQAEINELYNDGKALDATVHSKAITASTNLKGYFRNNGLSTWTDLSNDYSNNGTPTSLTETILIPQGVDSTRDTQGFIMNKQKDTSCLNLTNGSDNPYVDLGSETVVAADDAVSFSVWLKPDDVVQNYFLGHSSQNSIKIYDATTIFYRADNAPVNFTVQTIIPEQWVHVVLVKAGGGTDEMSVYVNGALNGTASTDTETSNEPLDYRYLGAERDWTNSFRGAVDGFLIYNKALDGTEILRNYNATKGNHRN